VIAVLDAAVLVLNQNYEPLDVCSWQRAMVMIISGKAEIVENGRGVIHTPTTTLPLPSVVRLRYLVHRPRPRVKLNRKEIFRRDNYTCQYCGRQTTNLTVDHVVPRHCGGTYSWENLVSACPQCNRRKGGKTLREAGMTLLRTPYEPRASLRYLFGNPRYRAYPEWKKFLIGWGDWTWDDL
jgi:5-methylcytosine-specific restriction endonuclease McrA